MKVAMLTYSTNPRGGVVHALKLSERLADIGVDVRLYSLARSDDAKALKGYFREVSVPFEIFPYEWDENLIERLDRMIRAYSGNLPRDADIYHAQDCVGGTALSRMKAEGAISAPVFRTVHHVDDFAEPALYEFERKAVTRADHRFVVSRYWQNRLMDEYGLESTIAYNGLDVSDFDNLPDRRSTQPTVLFVGGLEPRKALEYLVLAMEIVMRSVPDAQLVAVAKAGFRGKDGWGLFDSLAERLGIAGGVRFLESVSQERLLGLYADCDVLVLPSKTEGWGLSLMEAMACGKPVVASRVGGVPELVRDGTEGILVEPRDVKGLAQAITRVLTDEGLRHMMGQAGRERVKSFLWEDTAGVVRSSYEAALTKMR